MPSGPDPAPVYAGFLGAWVLDPRSCNYEQGEAPRAGSYTITERSADLVFDMHWVDSSGEGHDASFAGPPDGAPHPFDGGALADALVIEAVSPRELNTRALYKGRECMVAQRQLDESGRAMRVIQLVRSDGGAQFVNQSVYVRAAVS